MKNEKRMAAAALLVSVFVAGAVAGVAAWQVVDSEPDRFERPFERAGADRRGPRGGPDRVSGRSRSALAPMWLTRRLADELDLTADQVADIEAIIEEREAVSAELLREMRPRIQAQLDTMNSAIRILLTPEQQDRFDEFVEAGRERSMRPDGRFDRGRDGRDSPRSGRRRAPRS